MIYESHLLLHVSVLSYFIRCLLFTEHPTVDFSATLVPEVEKESFAEATEQKVCFSIGLTW